jgi:hypothetical protein
MNFANGTPTSISEIVAIHNKLNSMTDEELWNLADELEMESYSPDRGELLDSIVKELVYLAQQIEKYGH